MERVNDRPAPHGAHGAAVGGAGAGTAEHALYVGPHHPRAGTYIGIFVVLFLVTAAEVGVGLAQQLGDIRLPALFTLMILKGALIAAFYMHLRFDSRIFSVFFLVGLILFAGMIFSFMMLFTAHARIPYVPTLAEKSAAETSAGAAGSTSATGASSTAGAITTPTVAR